MGVSISAPVWDDDTYRSVSGSKLIILLALADWSNSEGESWYKIAKLARRARLSIRRTQELVAELERDGFLAISESVGRGYTNTYRVTAPDLHFYPSPHPQKRVRDSVMHDQKGAKLSIERVRDSVEKGAKLSIERVRDSVPATHPSVINRQNPSVDPSNPFSLLENRYQLQPCAAPHCTLMTSNPSGFCDDHKPRIIPIHQPKGGNK